MCKSQESVVLDVCFNAVEHLAQFLEDNADRIDAEADALDADPVEFTARLMRTLGASMGNFLYTYSVGAQMDGLIEVFQKGIDDYVAHCKELDKPKEVERRTPLRLVQFMGVDNSGQGN